MTRVEVVVIGVALCIGAVRLHRIQVAHALAVGNEVHAVADPHRARDVAGELGHAPERPAARGVDPKVSRRAAAITLPPCRVRGVAADHHRLAGTVGEMVHLAQRQELRHAAGGIERVRAVVAEERLAVRSDEEDVALAREAAHHHVRAEPRHAARGPAFGGHQIDLGVLLVAAHEREPLAVRRQAGRGGLAQTRGQAACRAAFVAYRPQVVVADEDQRVPAQRGISQIPLIVHGDSDAMNGGNAADQSPRAANARW